MPSTLYDDVLLLLCCLQAVVKVVFLAAVVGVVGSKAPTSFSAFNKAGAANHSEWQRMPVTKMRHQHQQRRLLVTQTVNSIIAYCICPFLIFNLEQCSFGNLNSGAHQALEHVSSISAHCICPHLFLNLKVRQCKQVRAMQTAACARLAARCI
jgi:hypothetical protein